MEMGYLAVKGGAAQQSRVRGCPICVGYPLGELRSVAVEQAGEVHSWVTNLGVGEIDYTRKGVCLLVVEDVLVVEIGVEEDETETEVAFIAQVSVEQVGGPLLLSRVKEREGKLAYLLEEGSLLLPPTIH